MASSNWTKIVPKLVFIAICILSFSTPLDPASSTPIDTVNPERPVTPIYSIKTISVPSKKANVSKLHEYMLRTGHALLYYLATCTVSHPITTHFAVWWWCCRPVVFRSDLHGSDWSELFWPISNVVVLYVHMSMFPLGTPRSFSGQTSPGCVSEVSIRRTTKWQHPHTHSLRPSFPFSYLRTLCGIICTGKNVPFCMLFIVPMS